jgi:hypothetical protein
LTASAMPIIFSIIGTLTGIQVLVPLVEIALTKITLY